MNQSKVQTASKLLAKAQSTSPHEAVALVERAYSLLAQVITEYDEALAQSGGARRRERRRLQERRRRAREVAAGFIGSSERPVDSIDRYRGTTNDDGHAWPSGIDVKL